MDHQLPEVAYRESQPGLEVAHQGYEKPGLEVVYASPKHGDGPYEGPSNIADSSHIHPSELVHHGTPSGSRRRKRFLIFGGIAISVIVIVAAVVGGVLGSRQKSSESSPPSVSGASATAAPGSKPLPTSIIQGSAIGVTGWRTSSGFSIWLFYQGQDSYIRLSRFDSGTGSWTAPSSVIQAKPGSAIGASSFQVNKFFPNQPNDTVNQIELFYQNASNSLLEWNFLQNNTLGTEGSITASRFGTGATRMSAYWPSLIFQDEFGRLIEVLHIYGQGWRAKQLLNPLNFTGLANVPNDPGLAQFDLFFQRGDGKMINFFGNDTFSGSFAPGPLSLEIPNTAPIGAFAVPRPSSPTSQLDTYVLTQSASGDIQVSWHVDESGWQGPKTYPALAGADKNTSISCLTPNAYPLTNLKPQFDMSRCYFQAGGQLREVLFNGTDWVNLGNIPLP